MTWNLPAPRLGFTYALTDDGKTVLKGNYGKYWWNPGAQLSSGQQSEPGGLVPRYAWNDLNGDRLYQPGEEGRLNSSAGRRRDAGDRPEPEGQLHDEFAGWLEREVMPELRRPHRLCLARRERTWRWPSTSTVLSRLQRAGHHPGPGAGRSRGNTDDGVPITALQPERRRARRCRWSTSTTTSPAPTATTTLGN